MSRNPFQPSVCRSYRICCWQDQLSHIVFIVHFVAFVWDCQMCCNRISAVDGAKSGSHFRSFTNDSLNFRGDPITHGDSRAVLSPRADLAVSLFRTLAYSHIRTFIHSLLHGVQYVGRTSGILSPSNDKSVYYSLSALPCRQSRMNCALQLHTKSVLHAPPSMLSPTLNVPTRVW